MAASVSVLARAAEFVIADANGGLAGKIPSILAIMVMIVILLFNSIKKAIAIFLTIPLILVGVVAGLLGFDQPFGFMALLGFLSLVGMQIKNAIVLMDEINAQLAAGVAPFEAIRDRRLEAVRHRLLTTHETIAAIAADCGFESETHLMHLFKRRFGVTMRAFRRRARA